MIELVITRTSKGYNEPANEYRIYDREKMQFKTIKEAKEYLANEYFYCKTKYPMYRDKKDGKTIKVGYIYAFRGEPTSYGDKHWLGQDWVEFRKVTYSTITL